MTVLTLLIVASGAAGLIYQVLWMRMFSLLFGNTAYAAAAVLAGFLLGLALGYLVVGGRRRWLARPLRLYAILELGTGLSALPIPWVLTQVQDYYPEIRLALESFMPSLGMVTVGKALLALTILLPASMCMGGTLPALGDAIVGQPSRLGRWGGMIYGFNTIGAMIGGLAGGFWLPAVLGVQYSYRLAIGINVLVGVLAWRLSSIRDVHSFSRPPQAPDPTVVALSPVTPGLSWVAFGRLSSPQQGLSTAATSVSVWRPGFIVAGASGFCILGLEVLWTRMFAQVLQNSVYSYAAIVVTVLAGLALSAFFVSWSSLYVTTTAPALVMTTLAAGMATLASPVMFYFMTSGLQYQWMSESWLWYLVKLFALVGAVIGPAVVIGGMVLPLTWRLWESERERPGWVVGRTAAVNTFSGVMGALVAGFVLLPTAGLWRSLLLFGAVWFCAAAVAARGLIIRGSNVCLATFAGVVALLLAVSIVLGVSQLGVLPLVHLDDSKGERLVEVREGSQGIVAVVDRPAEGDRRLKVDNFYTLGGITARDNQLLEGQLPVLLHNDPKRVLYIGSATGISPAGALSFPVEQIVAVELIPDVIDLARRHFHEANQGLYEDSRVRAVAADGRNFLLGTREQWDVIVADLFIPWHAGTGSMYSREHFTLASSRLSAGGLFCQWLPLYQLSPEEFTMIATTFLRVFPQTTLWRGDFYADRPIVALIGHQGAKPIDLTELEQRLRVLRNDGGLPQKLFRDLSGVLMLYAGNLSLVADRFAGLPINTDDRPLLEYLAPRILGSGGREPAQGKEWFVGQTLAAFYRQLHADVLEQSDPIFPDQAPVHREYRMAGEFFYTFNVMVALGRTEIAAQVLEQVVDLLPESLYGNEFNRGQR